ncbi:hypothetical protein EB796_021787 [Bugula neritina]|uniref:Ras-associating domain-containing protein n=1 Tax=Bugula neritina TaxID=10212 RepID=A0A7J7J243_BUGNE|nr:hypothetical protein EB796_021787 [Bugula neritina]
MKALPLTSVGYDINSNPLDLQCRRSTDYSVSTNSRSPQRFRSPLADDVFDSFQKQFDKFSSEYTSVTSKHGYSRSQTHHIEESKHRVYSSRRHESEKISESRYRHSSGSSHLERTQEQRGRAPSPNVYLSSYFTRRESPARRTSSEDRLVRNTSDSVTEETLKQEVNSPRVRARLVLDKVLKDLVNKEGCRHQRGKSITKDASDTNKTCGNELNSCKGFQDDADSGYSGSGDTRAGFTCPTTDIKEQVRKYNENHQNNRFTKVSRGNTEETFHGDIQICMCLDHPVSMLLNTRPVSIFQSTQQNLGEDEKITASATIPQNTITKLRITSEDTSSVVIRHLLNKFNIIDSPKSYGLYEQTSDESDKEVKLRKISSTEKPLIIFLQWNSKPKEKKKFL